MGQPLLEKEKDENNLFLYVNILYIQYLCRYHDKIQNKL